MVVVGPPCGRGSHRGGHSFQSKPEYSLYCAMKVNPGWPAGRQTFGSSDGTEMRSHHKDAARGGGAAPVLALVLPRLALCVPARVSEETEAAE